MNLKDPVSTLPYVGESFTELLKKLSIETIDDLLHHIPSRLADYTNTVAIKDLKLNEKVTLTVELVSITNVRTKTGKVMQVASVTDNTAKLQVIWVGQPYLLKLLRPGMIISLFGELKFWGKQRAFVFPKFEILNSDVAPEKGKIMTSYPLTEGLNHTWISKRVKHVLDRIELEDFLEEEMRLEFTLHHFKDALENIHFPKSEEAWLAARRRLAFNELLLLQLQNAIDKMEYKQLNKAKKLELQKDYFEEFIKSLPFSLTSSQEKAIKEISRDLAKSSPMNRLLEGDVGSGKTVVAAFGVFVSFAGGSQSVFLAPTQVLAEQHFKTLQKLLSPFNLRISLITGDRVEGTLGRADLFVGTHALLYRPELYENTNFIVIDEQHRFGVKQRAKILEFAKKDGVTPHLLTMTATPIPRTVTLTMYGDLDLTSLDELPKGRKKIKTWVVPKAKRKAAYRWIEEQIVKDKVQVFVVCPLIEESEAETFSEVKAAAVEYEKLKEIFPKLKIGLMHGRLKAQEKTEILENFRDKKLDILVTTPVVEVGVDIPNATIMMIEGADRFGLAQLHQLRGRVGRGEKQSYCLLFTETKSSDARKRLKTLETVHEGRKLAEIDLELRGPGEIFGVKQSGLPELRIASWTDIDLIKKTKSLATKIAKNQHKHPRVMEYYKSKQITQN